MHRFVLALSLASLPAFAQPADPHPDTTFVAVVIGISAYEHMPEEVELDFARSDAATVANALQDHAAFDAVWLLTDRNATKAGITEVLREQAPQRIGPQDVLVVYFVGHGIGSDLGMPTLLAYDSTVQHGHEDGFPAEQFGRDLATWTRAGTTLLVTDAIHKNQLDGIYFYGPSAEQWPGIGPRTMVISSSQTQEPAKDGAFGVVFAEAFSGAADADDDRRITAKELREYLAARMAASGQTPVFAGTYDDDMVLAAGIVKEEPKVDEAVLYGDHDVHKAKFVFRDGGNPTVQCRGKDVQPCDSSCYVYDFKAGPCAITAFVDGRQVKGTTLVMVPGKYDCGLMRDGSLKCIPPPTHSAASSSSTAP